mmetsp:Transcript_72118/g.218151  ORF Transcript_72118/g.218151 Transcript_72118/m.218151 type:complete len:229 (+) Transcript_72118:318-1004(+)
MKSDSLQWQRPSSFERAAPLRQPQLPSSRRTSGSSAEQEVQPLGPRAPAPRWRQVWHCAWQRSSQRSPVKPGLQPALQAPSSPQTPSKQFLGQAFRQAGELSFGSQPGCLPSSHSSGMPDSCSQPAGPVPSGQGMSQKSLHMPGTQPSSHAPSSRLQPPAQPSSQGSWHCGPQKPALQPCGVSGVVACVLLPFSAPPAAAGICSRAARRGAASARRTAPARRQGMAGC